MLYGHLMLGKALGIVSWHGEMALQMHSGTSTVQESSRLVPKALQAHFLNMYSTMAQ